MAKTLDQMLAAEKPEVVTDAREKAAKILLGIHLADLREHAKKNPGRGCLGSWRETTDGCGHGKVWS